MPGGGLQRRDAAASKSREQGQGPGRSGQRRHQGSRSKPSPVVDPRRDVARQPIGDGIGDAPHHAPAPASGRARLGERRRLEIDGRRRRESPVECRLLLRRGRWRRNRQNDAAGRPPGQRQRRRPRSIGRVDDSIGDERGTRGKLGRQASGGSHENHTAGRVGRIAALLEPAMDPRRAGTADFHDRPRWKMPFKHRTLELERAEQTRPTPGTGTAGVRGARHDRTVPTWVPVMGPNSGPEFWDGIPDRTQASGLGFGFGIRVWFLRGGPMRRGDGAAQRSAGGGDIMAKLPASSVDSISGKLRTARSYRS